MTISYQNRRKLQNSLCLFNMAAALFVFWRSSWFSIAVDKLSHFRSIFSLLFDTTFCLILLGNMIILSVYALPDHDDTKTGGQSDILDEFINDIESRLEISTNGGSPSTMNDTEERHPIVIANSSGDNSPEKQILRSEFVESPVLDRIVTAVTETRATTCRTTTNGEKVWERKRYRRIKSESFEQELNRMVDRDLERRLCSLEELTMEEFNRAVEDFIAKQKRRQWEEHKESYRTEHLALTQ